MKTYKTVTGYAIHGHTEDLASLRAMFADGHVPMLFKFFNCDAAYIATLQDAFPTDTAFVVRYFERGGWHSDKSKEWLGAFPSIRAAAESYLNHFAADFSLLADIPRTVYVENFNEPSVGNAGEIARICQFNAEVGKLIKSRYGEELKLAALSLASGNFNELPTAQLIADNLIRPLMASNVEFALSLHCYSSLAMPVWNEPYLGKADIERIYREGNPAVEINLDAPIRLDLSVLPAAYTGFGHERLYVHLRDISIGGEDLHEVPMMLTESLLDNMGDPGMGGSAGGYLEWERKGLLSRIKRPNESAGYFAARNMIYAERRYQAEIKAGMNLVGVTPFLYDDVDPSTRWSLDYELKGEPYNVFKDAMRIGGIEIPPPEEETLPTGIKLYWPVEDTKRAFNQAYGANVPYYAQFGLKDGHEGIDFYAPTGTNIYSCADGVVKVVNAPGVAGYQSGHNYGIHVRITHPDGYETIYAHFEKSLVNVGDSVKASQVIGIADSTGNSTGSHLHLTLKKDGVIINPTDYLVRQHATPQPPTPVTCDAITTDALRVRSAPDTTKDNILFVAAQGATLSPTHQLITRGENWYRVIYTNNGIIGVGWCVARFTTRAASCPVLPVWVEPTPEPEPEPEPPDENAAVIAELMPVFRDIQAGALALQAHTQRAEVIFQKYVKD